MGRLYLDAAASWSNPAESGLKVLDATGAWTDPMDGRRALDAMAEWTAPELWKPPEDIADASWEDIEKLSALAAKNPQDYAKYLGQTKTVNLSAINNRYKNVTAMVIGIGQDVDPQGNKLGFTFQLRDGMPCGELTYLAFRMNDTKTTSGGWRDSLMRSTGLPRVKEAMPLELRSRLKTMVKKTHLTDSFNALVETQDELAILSQVEVFGENATPNGWSVPKGEGEIYQWYSHHSDRVIKNADGSAYYWWLRSVHRSTSFREIDAGGGLNDNWADAADMPCACFCI